MEAIGLAGGLADGLATGLAAEESTAVASLYLDFDNFQTEMNRIAAAEGHDGSSGAFQGMVNYILYDAAAFNLSGPAALNANLDAGNVMLISDADTYGAAYTP